MVGKTGFEPATPWSQTRCTTKLCYFPTNGALGRNRTHNLLIRSQALYPVELLAHFVMLTYISIIHFYLQVFFNYLFNGAQGRNRTGTDFEVRRILSPVRLPVSPPGQHYGGSNRTRTDDNRVAVCCLTNLAMEPLFRFSFLPPLPDCFFIICYLLKNCNPFLQKNH